MAQRRDRGDGGLYQRASDGLWVATVELTPGADGRRRRKVIARKRKEDAQRELRDLRAKVIRNGGDLPQNITVAAWLDYWLEHVTDVKPRTAATYRSYVENYLKPTLGRRRIDQLQPAHVRAMSAAIVAGDLSKDGRPLSTTTALQAHRILVKATKDARRDGHPVRDFGDLVAAPRRAASDRGSMSVDDCVQLLRVTDNTEPGTRWAFALLLGARPGERLGLEWDRVDLDAGTVDLAWQLQRLPFRHGCATTASATGWPCGHARGGSCPRRRLDVRPGFEHRQPAGADGGLVLTRPKSRSGQRLLPLPAPALAGLTWLRDQRAAAGVDTTSGLVWVRPDGQPIDPKDDGGDWHASLEKAGLPPVTLYAARHTTASLLLRLGVPGKVVQSIMGHSSVAMSEHYQHADLTLQRAALDGVGRLLALD